jgi:hypothetical protein
MISKCPYCETDLNLTEAQQQKVTAALAGLKSGTLKLGCPHCKHSIQLKPDGSLLLDSSSPSNVSTRPNQPSYPDISWLAGGMFEDKKTIEDIPRVMVLMPDGAGRSTVVKIFENIGYQVEVAESPADAIAKMRFVVFAAVVLHSTFDGSLEKSKFHNHMRTLSMDTRRYIYYILVGSEFHTLYDLEALSYSANLVINDNEIDHFDIILRKGLRDYDELFGPYISALKEHDV